MAILLPMAAFDPRTIPYEKIITWFKAPDKEDDVYVSGSDGHGFRLEDLSGMEAASAIAERGHDYYTENRVVYLCIDRGHGRGIVEGASPYEIEFDYGGGPKQQPAARKFSETRLWYFCGQTKNHPGFYRSDSLFAPPLQNHYLAESIAVQWIEAIGMSLFHFIQFRHNLLSSRKYKLSSSNSEVKHFALKHMPCLFLI